ncbi:hypothetical protein M430DRAFT_208967 [Amorphotheca resinae ATCC 22711]|uniref:Uncharacterized protein n=1 Tax=Amorphotheca resinae ATCC 22711 TaxID=857342 RepID=A0A2T3B782_AMORE|nr:hypothetical protein M430DRAFT_208967 [Amorphotheca resinae ATCC 22711]PSS22738.1 hypothetical protein M430DRAFT_208967 [Amorphotheca resinae ATCC 22711]
MTSIGGILRGFSSCLPAPPPVIMTRQIRSISAPLPLLIYSRITPATFPPPWSRSCCALHNSSRLAA